MRYLGTFLLFFLSLKAVSQKGTISVEGTIKGPKGNAVVYATIKNKHDRSGTSAYSDGGFKLNEVKIGDTLLITQVCYRQSYFVVDRKYNKLDLVLPIDTLYNSIRKTSTHIIFNFGSRYLMTDNYALAKFSETSKSVYDEKWPDGYKMFTKVEVMPIFYVKNEVFDSLFNSINKLPKKNKPKKDGNINIYYWVRSDKKIEISYIESPYKEELNNIFSSLFEQVKDIFPAIQNGRNVGVFCVTKFGVEVNKESGVIVRVLPGR